MDSAFRKRWTGNANRLFAKAVSPALLGILFLSLVVAGCGGATDSRIIGVWENRQGFSKSTRMKLAADGNVTVATQTDGKTSNSSKGSWHVIGTRGNDRLTLEISLSGKGARTRSVKFLNEDLIEMSDTKGAGLRRFTRVSN